MPMHFTKKRRSARRGAVLVFVALFALVAILLVAMVVDVGFVAMTKTQLQAGADSAALAGGMELYKGLGVGASHTPAAAQTLARLNAATFASNNRAGDRSSIFCNGTRDVRFGNAVYNPSTSTWQKSWNTAPYNMIGVTLLRNQPGSTAGDGPLPLFFSGLVGATANLSVGGTAALLPSNTFKIPTGSPLVASILPLTIDLPTWVQLMNNTGPDAYNYNSNSNSVTKGSDGIREIDLYPSGTGPSGNRGLLDLGTGNAASEISRQIATGVTAADLAGFPGGELTVPSSVAGAPGLKTSLKDDLTSIIGQPRSVAVFESTSGTGDNTVYSLVKFVGVRIVGVDMTGNPKHVWAQPAPIVDPALVPDLEGEITPDSIFSPVILIE